MKWLVGLYAFDLNAWMTLNVLSSDGLGGPTRRLVVDPDMGTTSLAGFAEVTDEFVDDWFLTLGGRYTWEERTFKQFINGVQVPFGTAKESYTQPDYRVAIRYRLSDKANVFASYGTGFKSGVFNGVSASPVPVKPETVKAAEIGIKIDPLSWLRTNLSVYRYEYEDLQVTARSADLRYVLQNAASVTSYGGEFEVVAAPVPGLQLRASVAYMHGEFDSFPGAQTFVPLPTGGNEVVATDASGKQLNRAPEWTYNFGFDWGVDLTSGRLGLAGNLFHSSRVYHDAPNLYSQKPYTM